MDREHVAWLLWCVSEGYVKREDRAGIKNWVRNGPAALHPDDALLRDCLLTMADELIAAAAQP